MPAWMLRSGPETWNSMFTVLSWLWVILEAFFFFNHKILQWGCLLQVGLTILVAFMLNVLKCLVMQLIWPDNIKFVILGIKPAPTSFEIPSSHLATELLSPTPESPSVILPVVSSPSSALSRAPWNRCFPLRKMKAASFPVQFCPQVLILELSLTCSYSNL